MESSLSKCLQGLSDCQDEIAAAECNRVVQSRDPRQIPCHLSGFNCLKRCLLQTIRERYKLRKLIQLPSLPQCSRPGKDCCDGICGGLLALQILVIMALYGSMCCLIFAASYSYFPSGFTRTDVIIAREPKADESISLITSPS